MGECLNSSPKHLFLRTASRAGLKRIAAYISFLVDFYRFRRQSKLHEHRFSSTWKDRLVCLSDKTGTTEFDRHYVLHTAWAARILARTLPEQHVDISSSLYFVAVVSAFRTVLFYDYRPAELQLDGLQCNAADLKDLPFADETIESLSCMHVVEHVGLGRYGEAIDPVGDLKAITELKRVLTEEGNLLFVVPVGRPKLMFNAHRIYSYAQIASYFSELELVEFALIPDNPADGHLISNADQKLADAQSYGCGCFWFKKSRYKDEIKE